MSDLREDYIKLLLEYEVLRFGEFRTKSGRVSPYFFNTGRLDCAAALDRAAMMYARAIVQNFGGGIDNLFGPAYKGIPLAVATASCLAELRGGDVSFTFNRKEVKDHGEGGRLVGRGYEQPCRTVVVEDVITGGTSFRETLPHLKELGVHVAGVIVGVDRQEKGQGDQSALAEIGETYGVATASIVTVSDVVRYLHGREVLGNVWIDDATKVRIDGYLDRYGAFS